MNWSRLTTFAAIFALALPAAALQPPQPPQRPGSERSVQLSSIERWVQQLENDIDHLEEDLHFERGSYPADLSDQVDQASRAVAHFRRVLRRTSDRQHLLKDFQEMDQQVHQLVRQLEQSDDRWLRRQAARISYADEQLHFVLKPRTRDGEGDDAERELLARHAHVLETEARNLQSLVERFVRRGDPIHGAIADFVDEVEHFHQVVERGVDPDHLTSDFAKVDESWHLAVSHLNRSSARLYLLRRAQDVNRVHNQIHELVSHGPEHDRGHEHEEAVEPPQRPQNPRPAEPRRGRPTIEFEIPGVGRFEFPR